MYLLAGPGPEPHGPGHRTWPQHGGDHAGDLGRNMGIDPAMVMTNIAMEKDPFIPLIFLYKEFLYSAWAVVCSICTSDMARGFSSHAG